MTDPQPLRFPPLDQGDRVAIDVHLPDDARSPSQAFLDVVDAFGAPADLVLVAVPKGKGVTVMSWLQNAWGVEETNPPGREEAP